MRVLVLSDIHGNLAALEAVLEDAAAAGYDATWCLGDLVGYGPEPNECVTRVRLLQPEAVVGNHDWAVLKRMSVEDFNPEARRAVLWTRQQLSTENLAWLSDLSSTPIVRQGFTLTHGSPRDPIWEYILYPSTAESNLSAFSTAFCLVGHTHVPAVYLRLANESTVRAFSPPAGLPVALAEVPGTRGILNPGSVGQPRDNDPRAAYAILDTEQMLWQQRRVPYPVEITQAHMLAAGLPERLINRLAYGW